MPIGAIVLVVGAFIVLCSMGLLYTTCQSWRLVG